MRNVARGKTGIWVGTKNHATVDTGIMTAVECLRFLREADRTRRSGTRAGACATMSGGFPQIPGGQVSMQGLSLCRDGSTGTGHSNKSKVEINRVAAKHLPLGPNASVVLLEPQRSPRTSG